LDRIDQRLRSTEESLATRLSASLANDLSERAVAQNCNVGAGLAPKRAVPPIDLDFPVGMAMPISAESIVPSAEDQALPLDSSIASSGLNAASQSLHESFELPEPLDKARDGCDNRPSTTVGTLGIRQGVSAAKKGQGRAARFSAKLRKTLTLSEEDERTLLRRLAEHPGFDLFYGFCILTNGVFIGIQTDWLANNPGADAPLHVYVLNIIYTVLFVVELVLRIYAGGCTFYFWSSPQLMWNYLDVVIVGSSLIELVGDVAAGSGDDSKSKSSSMTQLRILRIARITRLIRIIRITRIVRFIRALRTMVHQLTSTVKSLVWAIVLLILVIYLFAIFFTQSVTNYRVDSPVLSSMSFENLEIYPDSSSQALLRYWATLPRSMFTLYMSITGGISWVEVIHPLSDVSDSLVVVFVSYVILAQLAVLNVVTGVFCQNAMDSASHDQELVTQQMLDNKQAYITRLQDIFRTVDSDGSGTVTFQEFRDHLDNEPVKAYFESLELDVTDVSALFQLLDSDDGNLVDLDEFVTGLIRLRGSAKRVDVAVIMQQLAQFIQRTDASFFRLHSVSEKANTTPRRDVRHLVA